MSRCTGGPVAGAAVGPAAASAPAAAAAGMAIGAVAMRGAVVGGAVSGDTSRRPAAPAGVRRWGVRGGATSSRACPAIEACSTGKQHIGLEA